MPTIQRVGLAAKAVHRKDPGAVLQTMLTSSDVGLRARVLKAVGELGLRNLASLVSSSLSAEDPSLGWWAAWSGAILGDGVAIPILQQLGEKNGPYAVKAATMAVRRMSLEAAHRWIRTLAENPETLRVALYAAGALGDPTSIPWLIENMAVPALARVAGESFTMITGVDLAYDDLDTDKPEGFDAGPTEDPEDENVEMDQDEDLPWPTQRTHQEVVVHSPARIYQRDSLFARQTDGNRLAQWGVAYGQTASTHCCRHRTRHAPTRYSAVQHERAGFPATGVAEIGDSAGQIV